MDYTRLSEADAREMGELIKENIKIKEQNNEINENDIIVLDDNIP